VLGLASLALPDPAACYDCPLNRRCNYDYTCQTGFCELACVAIDRYGLDKRCLRP
jgi:hypothetical protein